MGISISESRFHWNYYIAIEQDLEKVSRYIEFSESNLSTYSIELARILFSASSEVDVIMKSLCNIIQPDGTYEKINHYKPVILEAIPDFWNETVQIPRFGMSYKPWLNWQGDHNPIWWKSYNNVKHKRNLYFNEANLQNVLNSVGALLITVFHYYKHAFTSSVRSEVSYLTTMRSLDPPSQFFRLSDKYYERHWSEMIMDDLST